MSRNPALAAVAALALGGCVNFDRETVVLVMPPDSKELRAVMVYEGIHATGSGAPALKEAQDQLARFVESRQEFCLIDNWITHVVLTPEQDDDPKLTALKTMLRGELTVQNHACYLEGDKLCGYQTVVARDRDRLVAELNRIGSLAMAEAVREELKKPKRDSSEVSEESLRRLEKAARDGFAWLKLGPGRLSFTFPVTAADAKNMKEKSLGNMRFHEAVLKDNPVTITADESGYHVSLGEGGGKPVRYTIRTDGTGTRFPDAKMIEFAHTLKLPFKDGLTTERVVAEFLKGGR
jgi:hypothetical protein